MSKEQTLYAQEKLVVRSELITIDTSDNPGLFISGVPWNPLTAGEFQITSFQGKIGAAGSVNGGFSGTATLRNDGTVNVTSDGFIPFSLGFVFKVGGMWCFVVPAFSCNSYDSSKGHILAITLDAAQPQAIFPIQFPPSGSVPGITGWFEINSAINNFPSRCQIEGSTVALHTQVVPNTGIVQIANISPIYIFYFI